MNVVRRVPALVALAVAALGCPSPKADAPPIGAADAAASTASNARDAATSNDAAAALDLRTDAGGAGDASSSAASGCSAALAPKVLAKIACVEQHERIEGRVMGYSRDGRYFGFCISSCDACPLQCELTATNRPTVSFAFAAYHEIAKPQLSDEEVQRRIAAIDAPHHRFLEEKGFSTVTAQRTLHGPWKYPDLTLATRSTTNETKGTGVLEVGASVDGDEPVFPLRLEVGGHPMWNSALPKDSLPPGAPAEERKKAAADWRGQWAMKAAIAAVVDVPPDGKELGVVAFSSGAMWFEDARATRIGIDAFAARVYADASRGARTRGDSARAAELDGRAAAARAAK